MKLKYKKDLQKIAKDHIIKKIFSILQRLGINLTLNHFYSPIPNLRELREYSWEKHSDLIGLELNEEKQLELLNIFKMKYKDEYDKFLWQKREVSKPYDYFVSNTYFEALCGEILYCMIRHYKPRRIIEIGSGYSTYLSAHAILKNKEVNENYKCELIAIEPYPNDIFRIGFPGLSKLITKKVQELPINFFRKLEENDILFVDSSHALKTGGDVQYEYLEIIPRMRKGVIIHLHDIFLPAEYPKEWILKDKIFWNEQYLLQAFLAFNSEFEMIKCQINS